MTSYQKLALTYALIMGSISVPIIIKGMRDIKKGNAKIKEIQDLREFMQTIINSPQYQTWPYQKRMAFLKLIEDANKGL